MMRMNQWIFKEYDASAASELSRKYQIPEVIAVLLAQRGLLEDGAIRSFLKPRLENLHDPLDIIDMDKAVRRIRQALEKGEKITVYGDYDVDGITSVTILVRYLRSVGADVDYYIPDRISEGYGINVGALQAIMTGGTRLMVTVDSGITACDEVEFAMKNGMDVVVTDHHECQEEIPQCCAVVDAKREGSRGFCDYCGAGVALMLVLALEGMQRLTEVLDEYVEFAALGTVADVMPLLCDNRILVTEGLKRLPHTKNKGIRSLLAETQLLGKEITATKIAYVLAPRINAAGRLGKAERAVELFLSEDEQVCARLARELCNENDQRKSTESVIMEQAVAFVEQQIDLEQEKILVISGEGWHHGVLGIVTSKITEKYRRPAILISFDENGIGKGSGRSIHGFSLFAALTHCSRDLIRYGGHEMAAGLSVDREHLEPLRRGINEYASGLLTQKDFLPKIHIDSKAAPQDLTLSTYKKLQSFEPFGAANPEPVFSLSGAKIVSVKRVGMDKHVKLVLSAGGQTYDAIGFGMGEYADFLKPGSIVEAAFTLTANDFFSPPRLQLVLKDIRW